VARHRCMVCHKVEDSRDGGDFVCEEDRKMVRRLMKLYHRFCRDFPSPVYDHMDLADVMEGFYEKLMRNRKT